MARTRWVQVSTIRAAALAMSAGWAVASGAMADLPAPVPAPAAIGVPGTLTFRLDPLRPTRAVPVRLSGELVSARDGPSIALDTSSAAPSVVAVERSAAVLPGESLGWAWLRPVGVGRTVVTIGQQRVSVEVVDGSAIAEQPREGLTLRPRVTSPTSGAGVTGTVRIGVSAWREPWTTGRDAEPRLSVRVRRVDACGVATGNAVLTLDAEPLKVRGNAESPTMLASCELDTHELSPGTYVVECVRTLAAGEALVSEPVTIVVPRGSVREDETIAGECETDYAVLLDGQMGPPKPVKSSEDKAASGGRFFSNAGADPKFRFPVSIPRDGYYQVVLRAAGDAAAGALPGVGITIDEAQRPLTTGQLASGEWHRASIGVPIRLNAGEHIVRCDFANDFNARGLDRNLRLDAIELVRVGDVPGASDDSDAKASMTAMTNMAAADETPSMMTMQAAGGGAMSTMAEAASMQAMSGEVDGGASADDMGGGWPLTGQSAFRPPVRVAIASPVGFGDVGPVRGAVSFDRMGDRQRVAPPRTELVVDGCVIWAQRSVSPRFGFEAVRTDGAAVPPDAHAVRLRTVSDAGFTTETSAMWADAEQAHAAKQTRRFTVFDAGWSGLGDKGWVDNLGGNERWSAPVNIGTELRLALPSELSGAYDVVLEARTRSGARTVEVQVEGSGKPVSVRVPSYFDEHTSSGTSSVPYREGVSSEYGTELVLSPGDKTLVIRDREQPKGRGGNAQAAFFIQAVWLRPRPDASLVARAEMVHPRAGVTMSGVDAAVVDVAVPPGAAVESVRLTLDGKPFGPSFDARRVMTGRTAVVPMILRDVIAGGHEVGAVVRTDRGQTVTIRAVPVVVAETPPETGTAYQRCVALLERIGFGADPRELSRVLRVGTTAYVAEALDEKPDDEARVVAAQRFASWRSGYDVPRRAIVEAMASGTPVQARFSLFAQNHFSTWIRKAEAQRKSQEHERFSRLGVTSFHDLLMASSTGPAMLRYLDQERSYAGRINENYAREIMELHCLGVKGGYSQDDVTNLAHVLAGWTTTRLAPSTPGAGLPDEDGEADAFTFEPRLASDLKTPRVVLGQEFGEEAGRARLQRVLEALELLSAHPATARFVCTKLVEQYVGAPADERLVADLAGVFASSDGDFKRVLAAMTEHPAFWSAALERSRVAQPLDFGLRLARVTGWNGPYQIGDYLAASGHGVFDRPTPDGYPSLDSEAIDSNAMLQRWKLASQASSAIADSVPSSMRYSESDFTDADAGVIIDIIAARLNGRLLDAPSRASALRVLAATTPALPARPTDWQRDGRIRTVAAFIAQLPESNMK